MTEQKTQPFVKPTVSSPKYNVYVPYLKDSIECKFKVYRQRTSDHVISIAL